MSAQYVNSARHLGVLEQFPVQFYPHSTMLRTCSQILAIYNISLICSDLQYSYHLWTSQDGARCYSTLIYTGLFTDRKKLSILHNAWQNDYVAYPSTCITRIFQYCRYCKTIRDGNKIVTYIIAKSNPGRIWS